MAQICRNYSMTQNILNIFKKVQIQNSKQYSLKSKMVKLFHFSPHFENQPISQKHSLVIKTQRIIIYLSKICGLLLSKSTFIAM